MVTWGTADVDIAARRGVLFDFDGTLADTKAAIVDVATSVLIDFGLDADVVRAHVGELIGPPFPEAYSLVFGLSRADADEVTRRYRAIYAGLGRDAWTFFDGISDLLASLRSEGRLLAAASSKRQSVLEMGIADNGAVGLFDVIVGKEDGVTDTKEEAIAHAVERLGLVAGDAVMVGDRHFDVEGAAALEIPCIGVLYGGTAPREELIGAGAVTVVDSVLELADVLRGRVQAP